MSSIATIMMLIEKTIQILATSWYVVGIQALIVLDTTWYTANDAVVVRPDTNNMKNISTTFNDWGTCWLNTPVDILTTF